MGHWHGRTADGATTEAAGASRTPADLGGRRGHHGPHRGRGPRGYKRSDDRIREDVCERLTDDPAVDASDIEVSVADGVVTLSGLVESRMAKRHAEIIIDDVPGIVDVQNNLQRWQEAAAERT